MARIDRRAASGAGLPTDRTRFFGREDDLLRLVAWHAGEEPLISIVGPGGIGKTRLARRFSLGQLDAQRSAGGVVFCDLAEARDADGIFAAVARALDVPLLAGQRAAEARAQLGAALAARGAPLVVLDNFEQVIACARETVGRWLDEAPQARFAVTSREPLGIDGEARLELGPLGDDEGAALLEDRARAARAGRPLDDEERAAAREIVRRLDGMPLAIELAAARAELLSLAELRDRLDRRFELLRGDRAGARHATLHAAIAWSWELLTPAERAALAQCSVFCGGFSVEAAEAVVDPGAGAPPVLDVLQALRRKSLLHAGARGADGHARVALYESIRAFAAAELGAPARAGAEARHAAYHAQEAERLAAAERGPGGAIALERLAEMRDNLLAAHGRSLPGAPATAARIALALDRVLALRGPLEARRGLLDAAVGAAGRAGDAALLGRALQRRGAYALAGGDGASAHDDCTEALRLARAGDDPRLAGDALLSLTALHLRSFDREAAQVRGAEALAVARALGDRALEADVLCELGELSRVFGRRDEAERCLEGALFLDRELGAQRAEAATLLRLGIVLAQAGRFREGRASFQRAHAIHREIRSRFDEARSLRLLGRMAHALGDLTAARELFDRGLSVARETGDRWTEASILNDLGLLLLEMDQEDEATASMRAAFGQLARQSSPHRLGHVHVDLAYAHLVGERGAEAEVELGEALRVAREASDTEVEGLALGALAVALSDRGAVTEAEALLTEARARLAGNLDQRLAASLDVLDGALDLARAGEAAARGQGDAARRHAARAAERRTIRADSIHVRVAMKILERRLARSAPGPAPAAPPDPAVEIERSGRWFRARGATRVSLARRPSLRLVLATLLGRRLERPGEGLSWEALLAAGWPGERVRREAGRNRVQVAIRTLRREGLEPLLRTGEDGYLLEPDLAIAVR